MISFPRRDGEAASAWTSSSTSTRTASTRGIGPIASGSALHTQVMKTEALTPGPGQVQVRRGVRRRPPRRGEEPRQGAHLLLPHCEPCLGSPQPAARAVDRSSTRAIRQGESIRVFPLSNWTELDIWQYIVPKRHPDRAALFRQGASGRRSARGRMLMVDDERLPLEPGETPEMRRVRFRTLGCYPLIGRHRIRRRERSRISSARC